ncbi:MAG: hypothetical protein PVJ53_06715 [Desulfobacterales bacterium]|jgi:hypothetical protein
MAQILFPARYEKNPFFYKGIIINLSGYLSYDKELRKNADQGQRTGAGETKAKAGMEEEHRLLNGFPTPLLINTVGS